MTCLARIVGAACQLPAWLEHTHWTSLRAGLERLHHHCLVPRLIRRTPRKRRLRRRIPCMRRPRVERRSPSIQALGRSSPAPLSQPVSRRAGASWVGQVVSYVTEGTSKRVWAGFLHARLISPNRFHSGAPHVRTCPAPPASCCRTRYDIIHFGNEIIPYDFRPRF